MDDLYRENILDHFKNPRNYGSLPTPTHARDEHNPLCGDQLHLELQVADDHIQAVGWSGRGCAISQAAASLLSETLAGRPVAEARAVSKQEVLDLLGIPIGPVRLKCALLSLKALKAALYGLDGPAHDDDDDRL